jgi:hypothetical protein
MDKQIIENPHKKLLLFLGNEKNHQIVQKYRAVFFHEAKKTSLKIGNKTCLHYRTIIIFPDFIGVSSYIDKLDSSNAEIKACQILQKRINKMVKDKEDLPVPMSDEQFNKFLDFYNENLNLKGFTGLFEVIYCNLTEIVIVQSVQSSYPSSAYVDILVNFFKNKKSKTLT